MSAELAVWFEERCVGHLSQTEPSELEFVYDPTWLEADDGFAISHGLPLQESPLRAPAGRYFANLLPEGGLRTAICLQLGLSEDNDFALLEALGLDCAGALVIARSGGNAPRKSGYERLDPSELQRQLASGPGYPAAIGDEVRLSLAGAQDKIAVKAEGNNLFLPAGGAASTHVLKLPNRDFSALPENEILVLRLARASGLPVPNTTLWRELDQAALLVERYDRVFDENEVRRLHQEDLCQALDVDRRQKYELEGGPTFADCYRFVRDVSVRPVDDTRALLRWLVFCTACGNRDNHAKNLSLVRSKSGRWSLAPFYDLVCTTAYPRIAKRLAMSVGGRADGGNLPALAWNHEAERLDVGSRYLLDVVDEVTTAMSEPLQTVCAELAAELGSDDRIVAVRRAIVSGVRRVRGAINSE